MNFRPIKQTALASAAEEGYDSLVSYLLMLDKSNLDVGDINGRTPLLLASANGHMSTVQILLANDSNPDLIDFIGRTPLSWAAANGHISIVELLLSYPYSANSNIRDALGQTAFLWACANGHGQLVSILLNRPDISPVNPKDIYDNSPLAIAAANGQAAVIEILLTHQEVLDDWVFQAWKEEITKDALRAKDPGEWNFKATIKWDTLISRMPQGHAMAHGHWGIVRLLRLRWEMGALGSYWIPEEDRMRFKMSMPDIFEGYCSLGEIPSTEDEFSSTVEEFPSSSFTGLQMGGLCYRRMST